MLPPYIAQSLPARFLQILYNNISRQRLLIILGLSIPFLLEALWNVHSFRLHPTPIALDATFQTRCSEPDTTSARENATFVMVARNGDLEGVKTAILTVEQQFNRWFNYPMVFLNNEPWEESFVSEVRSLVSGQAVFETISPDQWGYPPFIDQERARASMARQAEQNIMYAGKESYHHMCRFYSGMFYDHPALLPYRYYWRLEPDVLYTCATTYDPFRKMREHNKKYGYTIALWERGDTSPSLFRKVTDYRDRLGVRKDSPLWRAMVDPSWAPWPLRKVLAWMLNHRDASGNAWNFCHFWSNFEIGDLDFFRSQEYRDFFAYLDRAGGFYYERWGDAPVHSLAAAMFLEPRELHRFDDIGYMHPPFWTCPANAMHGQLPDSASLGQGPWSPEREDGVGCRCQCNSDDNTGNFQDFCLKKFDAVLRAGQTG